MRGERGKPRDTLDERWCCLAGRALTDMAGKQRITPHEKDSIREKRFQRLDKFSSFFWNGSCVVLVAILLSLLYSWLPASPTPKTQLLQASVRIEKHGGPMMAAAYLQDELRSPHRLSKLDRAAALDQLGDLMTRLKRPREVLSLSPSKCSTSSQITCLGSVAHRRQRRCRKHSNCAGPLGCRNR